jgi:eukaryotic-like serine/threonine-protein kinase
MKLTYPPEAKPLEGYTIKRAVARGGFGEVYYALSDAGKEVAIKLLRQNLEVELRGVSQCLNLNHPNLVSIYDIRTDKQGDHWIIMEYVSGKTLDRVLDDLAGPMPLKDVRHWLAEISSGLTYLHSRGLVHRDLKPANIFEHQGTIKIGDVGLSKFISQSQAHAQTQSVGTVYYMAPEVAHGRYGKTVDVYALGVMLFEMITGEVPFDGESQAEILMKHLSEQPDLNRLPPRLRPVLARALEKDPHRRYQSAAELEREFERAVKDLERSHDFAETIYHGYQPPRARVAPPVRDRYVERESLPHNRYRYSGPGERPGGLGLGKWILIGVVLLVLFPRVLANGHISKFLVVGGMAAAAVYAVRRLSRYATGAPVYTYNRPIDRRPEHYPPTREELRYASEKRREQRMAAMEERRETVRRAREARRAEKVARHHRAYANISPFATRGAIPLRQRMMELSASASLAAVTTVILTLGLMLASNFLTGVNLALFGAVTILGSWAVLATSKLLEGEGPYGWSNKRLVFLATGALVGVLAWFTTSNLFIEFATDANRNREVGNVLLTDAARQPTLAGFALFFAGLFTLRRWGWHADAFRERRFRLRSVLLTTGIGWLWALVIGFPILWAVTWAAALSSVVQLSACWVPPEERHRLVMETLEARNHV